MVKTIKFFLFFALSIIAYACSSDGVDLDKQLTKETQAQIDSCILKITDYVYTEIYDYPISKITLKDNKVKVFTTMNGRPTVPYDIVKPRTKLIWLELKTGHLNSTTFFWSNPWRRLPNITIQDTDSIYLVTVREVVFQRPEGYTELKRIKENIPFDKKGNRIETPPSEQ